MPMVSRYFQAISCGEDSAIIWHSIFGRPMLVASKLARSLSAYAKNRTRFELEELFGIGYYTREQEILSTIKVLSEAHILHVKHDPFMDYEAQEQFDIQNTFAKHNLLRQNKVESLSLIMSEECPFRCKYCMHFANADHCFNPEKMMSLEVAKVSIGHYINIIKSNNLKEGYINFGGGEPLLNWGVIEQLLPYIDEYRQKLGVPMKISINTNLALLTKDIAKTLIKYNVKVIASLDGTKKGNDAVRLTKKSTGTYDQINQGFIIMRNLGHSLSGFTMTVTRDNFFDLDTPIIDWAAQRRMREIRINIDMVGEVNLPTEKIVDRLIKIRNYAKTKDVSVVGFWSRPAENLKLIPEEEDVGFCSSERGNSLYIAPSGQVFPCGYSNYELGKYTEISTIYRNERYTRLLKHRNPLRPSKCQDCPIFGFCRGGCMVTRERNHNTDKAKQMCELYIAMTYEILRESFMG